MNTLEQNVFLFSRLLFLGCWGSFLGFCGGWLGCCGSKNQRSIRCYCCHLESNDLTKDAVKLVSRLCSMRDLFDPAVTLELTLNFNTVLLRACAFARLKHLISLNGFRVSLEEYLLHQQYAHTNLATFDNNFEVILEKHLFLGCETNLIR